MWNHIPFAYQRIQQIGFAGSQMLCRYRESLASMHSLSPILPQVYPRSLSMLLVYSWQDHLQVSGKTVLMLAFTAWDALPLTILYCKSVAAIALQIRVSNQRYTV